MGVKIFTKTYAGMDAIQGIKKDPRFNSLTGDAKTDIEQELKAGGTDELEEHGDDEGRMAKSQMYKMKDYVDKLSQMLDDEIQLPSWVQSKITKASDYMSAVYHYLEYEFVRKEDNLMEHLDNHRKIARKKLTKLVKIET